MTSTTRESGEVSEVRVYRGRPDSLFIAVTVKVGATGSVELAIARAAAVLDDHPVGRVSTSVEIELTTATLSRHQRLIAGSGESTLAVVRGRYPDRRPVSQPPRPASKASVRSCLRSRHSYARARRPGSRPRRNQSSGAEHGSDPPAAACPCCRRCVLPSPRRLSVGGAP